MRRAARGRFELAALFHLGDQREGALVVVQGALNNLPLHGGRHPLGVAGKAPREGRFEIGRGGLGGQLIEPAQLPTVVV